MILENYVHIVHLIRPSPVTLSSTYVNASMANRFFVASRAMVPSRERKIVFSRSKCAEGLTMTSAAWSVGLPLEIWALRLGEVCY